MEKFWGHRLSAGKRADNKETDFGDYNKPLWPFLFIFWYVGTKQIESSEWSINFQIYGDRAIKFKTACLAELIFIVSYIGIQYPIMSSTTH